MTDPEILSAIELHTVGKPAMSTLEMILYLADYIEPNRVGLSCLKEIRSEAFVNLKKAVYLVAKACEEHVRAKGAVMDERGLATLEYYKQFA